jgi:hypothetical protein
MSSKTREQGKGGSMGRELEELISRARGVTMSSTDVQEQRRSFAFGNAGFENPIITRKMVDEEDEARQASPK